LVHLIQNFPVLLVVPPLLQQFHFFEAFSLELTWIINVQKVFVHVYLIPFFICNHILNKSWFDPAKELWHLLSDVFSLVKDRIKEAIFAFLDD
jgi:hypothetical protein